MFQGWRVFVGLLLCFLFETSGLAVAQADGPVAPPAPSVLSGAKRMDVDSLKQRYWQNNGPDLEVVQNRVYTKSRRLNFQLLGAALSHDPFLNTNALGLSVGMNFTESFGVHLLYWKMFESDSPAVAALQNAETLAGGSLYAPNVNRIQSLLGGEVSWGILYGKLSLLGKAILHFDFFLTGGIGSLTAQNGGSLAPWVGIGQQIYLANFLAFRVDYRYLVYSERLLEQNVVANQGALLATRTTAAPLFSLGLSFYLF